MVFSGQNTSVEKHQGNNQPEHPLGFADITAFPSHGSVPSVRQSLIEPQYSDI